MILRHRFPTAAIMLSTICIISSILICIKAKSTTDDQLPPIRTEVRYQEDKQLKNDDPNKAWEEWDETPETRKNPFPKRQRKFKDGMNIHSIMGMAMRQQKVVTAVLDKKYEDEKVGQMIVTKFRNQMNAAGLGCKLWHVASGRQVIVNCETIVDGHMAKEYLVRQPEIIRTVIDNVAFSPKPQSDDDDDDDDDDDENDEKNKNDRKKTTTQKQSKNENKGEQAVDGEESKVDL